MTVAPPRARQLDLSELEPSASFPEPKRRATRRAQRERKRLAGQVRAEHAAGGLRPLPPDAPTSPLGPSPAPRDGLRALVFQRFASAADRLATAKTAPGEGSSYPKGSPSRIRALAEATMRAAEAAEIAASELVDSRQSYASAELRRLLERARLAEPTSTAAPSVLSRAEFHPSPNSADDRYLRARIRSAVRDQMPGRSTLRKCGERRQPRSPVAVHVRTVERSRDGATVRQTRGGVVGLVRCGSVQACPMCAPRVSTGRAAIVRAVVTAHREATRTDAAPGGATYMLTFTPRHTAAMPFRQLRKVRQDALRELQSGKGWLALKAGKYGLRELGPEFVGSIAARETTIGANGFHPHIHALWALARPLEARELTRLRRLVFCAWTRALRRAAPEHGFKLDDRGRSPLDPSYRHGVHLAASFDDDYLQKLGLADELTRALEKSGRSGNRTPFEVMADYARDGAARDAVILREFFTGIKGDRALTWSRSYPKAERDAAKREGRACNPRLSHDLRLRYLPQLVAALGKDKLPRDLPDSYGDAWAQIVAELRPQVDLRDAGFVTDVERIEAEDRDGAIVAELPGRQWDAFLRVVRAAGGNAEHELRAAAEEGGAEGVAAVLAAAWHLGRRLRRQRKRQWLEQWLPWLKPPGEHEPRAPYRLTTIAPQFA